MGRAGGEWCQDETESEIKEARLLKDDLDIEALRPPPPPPLSFRRRHGLLPVRGGVGGGALAVRLVGVVGGILRRVRPDAEEQVRRRMEVRIHTKLQSDQRFVG